MKNQDFSTLRAIILAAGLSSRMGGKPKALLPLGGATMLERAVRAFVRAGIEGIRVVTGYEAEQVAEEALRLGAKPVFNRDYELGMYTSICVGLTAVDRERDALLFPPAPVAKMDLAHMDGEQILDHMTSPGEAPAPDSQPVGIDAAFLLPVDAALVRAESIVSLARTWISLDPQARRKAVFIPSFDGWCGHPPLFGSDHFLPMVLWQGDGQWQDQWQWRGGLRDYLSVLMERDAENSFCVGRAPGKTSLALPARETVLHDCSVGWPREGTPEAEVYFLVLPDVGLTSDIDTPQALEEASSLLARTRDRRDPSPEEAWEWLRSSTLSEEKIRHCIAVALGALRLGLTLEKAGLAVAPVLHVCAGLLHDIARMHKAHARVGAEMVRELGWSDCAVVVGAHTVLPDSMLETLGLDVRDIPVGKEAESGPAGADAESRPEVLPAAACVYLADKFFYGDTHVSLARRFGEVKARFAGQEETLRAVAHREMIAGAVRGYFLDVSGQKPEETVVRSAGHPLEAWLNGLITQSPDEVRPYEVGP